MTGLTKTNVSAVLHVATTLEVLRNDLAQIKADQNGSQWGMGTIDALDATLAKGARDLNTLLNETAKVSR